MATTITTSQTASTLPQKKGDPPNFGTVKSGRALAFDGVVDKIENTSPSGLPSGNTFTIAVWIKYSGTSGNWAIFRRDEATNNPIFRLPSSRKIELLRYGSGLTKVSDTVVPENVWNRLVLSVDNLVGTFYLNGLADGTVTFGGSFVHANEYVVGEYSGEYANGYMSDLQVWDTAWTLADVTNDYTHPEMLAHTFSGTSLTESNLKLWLPMTEGNPESPQTTIFDGSPKVLGSELVINGGFDTDTDWTKAGEWSIDTVNGVAKGNGTEGNLTQTDILVSGKYYKATYTIKDYVSGSVRVELSDDNSKGITRSSNGTFTEIFKANNDFVRFDARTAFTGSIDDVSVKEIQRGNHATSSFYGEEMITESKNREFTGGHNWDVYDPQSGGSVTVGLRGGKLEVETSANAVKEGAFLDLPYLNTTLVVGKTYRVTASLDSTDGDTAPTIICSLGGLMATDSKTISETETTYDFDITPTNTTGDLMFYTNSGTATTFTIEDVTVKEVGLSTTGHVEGQETIFQPAFVGQNRMIAFDGVNDIVTISDNNDFTFGDGSNDSAFSISAWICMDDAVSYSIITKGTEWSLHTANSKLYLWIRDDSAGVNPTVNTNALSPNQWYHVVATYDGTGGATAHTGMELYVNGVDAKATADGHSSYVAMENGSSDVIIGKYSSYYANGITTEACIWNKELSLAEAQELYNNGVALDATSHSAVSNLKGYWRNNSLTTSGLWEDLSTNNNHGTLSGGSTVILPEGTTSGRDINGFFLTHPNKNYLSLDGVKTHVDVSGSEVFNFGAGSFTIEAWIKTTPSSGYQQIIWIGNLSLLARVFIASTGVLTFKVDDNSTEQDLYTDSTTWDDNTWSHLVCIRDVDDNKLKIYQDSALSKEDTLSATGSIDASSGVLIGKHHTDFNTNWKGFIDDVRIYNKALTLSEIEKNYRHGSGKHKD